MKHPNMAARLRALRESKELGEGHVEDIESGFTLIELMVVLLIMAILLAIAIPTFLSVTGGAKKTASQSVLTNSQQSVQAVATNHQGAAPPEATLVTDLKTTQSSITFQLGNVGLTPTFKGKNAVGVASTTTHNLVALSALDAAGVCWGIVMVLGNADGALTPGDHYIGATTGIATPVLTTACTATAVLGLAIATPVDFGKSFSTTTATYPFASLN